MIDRDRLREALAHHWDGKEGHQLGWDEVEVLAEAARLVADPDTLTIWWCESHGSAGDTASCHGSRIDWPPDEPCRMVERALLAQQTGDTK